jgi:multidrug resistance efflux pump
MRGKWLLFSVAVILLAIAAGALSVLRKPAVAPKKEEPAAPQLMAGDEVSFTGKIEAARIVPVPAPMQGVLDSWEVETGQDVLEGQVLGRVKNASLDTAQEQAQMELDRAQTRVANIEASILASRLEAARADADSQRARAESDQLEKLFQRQQHLLKEGATPRVKFDQAEKDYQSARQEAATAATIASQTAERVAKLEKDLELAKKTLEERTAVLEEAKADLESSMITAPVDGTVLSLKVEQGAEVDRAMQDLVQLAVDPAILNVIIEPDPPALKLMQPGQPALVTVAEVMGEGLPGEVKKVQDNQVTVEFTSPNPAIKHGMAAGVRIKLIPVEQPPPEIK